MTHLVVLTSRGQKQLVEVARWWSANRSGAQAARWLDGFEAAIANLSENPVRRPRARENQHFNLTYPTHELYFGLGPRPTHRAVFEIRGDTVFVVAIRHLAQDNLDPEDL